MAQPSNVDIKAVDKSKDVKDIDQISGDERTFIIASASKTKYELRPASFKRIPEVAKRISEIDDIYKTAASEGKTEMQLLMEENSPLLRAMANVMMLGLESAQPEITIDLILDNFAPIDFPVVYRKILDINDFLARMRSIQNQM